MRRTSLERVHALAQRDDRVVFIGSDLGPGTLDAMKHDMPERFFMEGIAEQNIIGMAAGMAMEGFIPYVNTIAPFFTRRAFEQVALDVCLHDLPVRLIANGGGLVYATLGPTHLAIEDIATMRALPNMTVVAVADAEEMTRFMERTLDWPHPIYIRLAKGGDPVVTDPDNGFEIGRAYVLREPGAVGFVTTGIVTGRALGACERLAEEGISAGVLHVPTVKPLDAEAVLAFAGGVERLIVAEEHTLIGGLGSAVVECLSDAGAQGPSVRRLGIPDVFAVHYGSQDLLMAHYGFDTDGLVEAARTPARAAQSVPIAR